MNNKIFMAIYTNDRSFSEVPNETTVAFGNTAEEAQNLLYESLCEDSPEDNPYYGEEEYGHNEKAKDLFVIEVVLGKVTAI